jgi:negative regulator of genetic competence, sporulation and motility
MFEAMRVGVDSLVVVVTKINDGAEQEQRFNLIPSARQECRFKRQGAIKQPPEEKNTDSYSVFSFDSLDLMAAGVNRLPLHYAGTSQAHKLDNRYFLLLTNETPDTKTTAELEAILYEFGQKHISNTFSHQYLLERGEIFIAENAVDKLRVYHSL